MGAFGDNLRREREMRGVALAEIAESTKISKRWLQALEDEQFSVLPGGVFNRGFVRAYARFLGINEEEAVADYIVASGEQPPPEDRFPLEIHEKPEAPPLNPKRSVFPMVLAMVSLVLVVGGWALWVKHKSTVSQAAAEPDSSSISISQAHESAASNPAHLKSTESQPPTRQVPPATQAKRNSEPDGTRVIHINARSSDGQGAETSGSISVVIKAKQDSWISIAVDGGPPWEETLTTNDERSVTADKELILKTGNAAGLEVSYNGKALGSLGKDKQVRTLTFNTAGLQQ